MDYLNDRRGQLMSRAKPFVSVFLGIAFGLLWAGVAAVWRGDAGDLSSGLCLARAIVHGSSQLYVTCPPAEGLPQDTIFAGLLMLPFMMLPDNITSALWIGMTSGVLAWALTRKDEFWRLLIFVTPAWWMTLWNMQAGALLCIIALFPDLLPFALYKPPQGLVIGLWRFSWQRAITSGVVLLISIIVWPTWLPDWLHQMTAYQSIIPLLVLPAGPLLLVALRSWRDDRTRLLLLMSCIPQRGMYNALLLYLIPQTIREMTIAVVASWIGVLIWITMKSEALGIVIGCYLPMLLICQIDVRRQAHETVKAH